MPVLPRRRVGSAPPPGARTRQLLLRRWVASGVFRTGLVVLLVEIALFAGLGHYYLANLERQIDRRAAERIEAPGRLMQEGLLRYALVGDREIMRRLVGDDLVLAMIVGRDLNIFYATDPPLIGTSAAAIPGVDPAWFSRAAEDNRPISATLKGSEALVTVAPLRALNSVAPFLYSYVAIDAKELAREKTAGREIVVLGSLLCIALTAFILFTVLARREAELANRAKSGFLAMMSHELRTPINAIVGILDLLRIELVGEKSRELIELCHLSSANLMRLIDDILDFAKAEAGALKLEPTEFSLAEAIEEVVGLLGARAGERGLDLLSFIDPRLPALFAADPIRVKQIFFNLIGNALKFTPSGHVAITAAAEGLTDATCSLLVEVSDSGAGLNEAQQAQLFQPFVQLDPAASRHAGGVGLGLSICRHLVSLMGGTIGVRSKPGEGTTFWVRLPLKVVAPPAPIDRRLAGLVVLLVEANPLARRFAAAYLAEEGAQVLEAATADAALTQLRERAAARARLDVAMIGNGGRLDGDTSLRTVLARAPAMRRTGLVLVDPPAVAVASGLHAVGGAAQAAMGRLARPYRRRELGAAVLAALGRPALALDAAAPGASSAEPTKLPEAAAMRHGANILVVDDNPVNRIVLRNFIEHLGLRADITNDGAAAWAAYQRKRYELVLTDCHMPMMDGFELARRIRAAERDGAVRVPIIALTADTLGETAEKCRTAGIDDRLCKPIRLGELQRVIGAALGEPDAPEGEPAGDAPAAEPAMVLDPAPLAAACGDDPKERAELLDLFFSSSERLLANLRAAVAKGDLADAEEAAHAAGGIAFTMGAYDFGNLCALAERHLRDGEREAAAAIERQLNPALERVRAVAAAL